MTDRQFETPMMQQYLKIKSEYKDCLLFFRLGDFYELFLEDAEIGSKILDITLTARNKGKDGKVAMCGVPYHAIDSYLSRIVKAGYKAAICEQVSDASAGPEIVERKVIRVVTPGTILNEGMLDRKTNNYLLTFVKSKDQASFAYSDISTGKFFVFSKAKTSSNKNIDDIIASEAKKISPQGLGAEFFS